jgi:hypothetical protein
LGRKKKKRESQELSKTQKEREQKTEEEWKQNLSRKLSKIERCEFPSWKVL